MAAAQPEQPKQPEQTVQSFLEAIGTDSTATDVLSALHDALYRQRSTGGGLQLTRAVAQTVWPASMEAFGGCMPVLGLDPTAFALLPQHVNQILVACVCAMAKTNVKKPGISFETTVFHAASDNNVTVHLVVNTVQVAAVLLWPADSDNMQLTLMLPSDY
ncbi:hypothetical protein OAM67_01900 [bacterium]|nr:hypothetical protein [bacterium]